MKKAAPVLVVALLGLVLGLSIWWVTRSEPVDPPIETETVHANKDFDIAEFIPTFDSNKDGQVTFEEFAQLYGKPLHDNSPPLIFHEDNNGPALNAREAFSRWDRDGNGIVNFDDVKRYRDNAWHNFKEDAKNRQLNAVDAGDKWMMLNEYQLRAYEAELAARKNGELPWAGKFWASRYLGKWAMITTEDGRPVYGYLSSNETRIFLLSDGATLTAYDPAKVTVDLAPNDDPHNQYVEGIKTTRLDDVAGNLELARKCLAWGMSTEAGMLLARVLIYDGKNQEALDALGLSETAGQYTQKGN